MYETLTNLQWVLVIIGVSIIVMPIIVTTFVLLVFKILWKRLGGEINNGCSTKPTGGN